MIEKHTNLKYDGSLPFATGDRHYGQDLIRDFYSSISHAGGAIEGLVGSKSFVLNGGLVTRAGAATVDISAMVAIIRAQVTVPNTYSTLPPDTRNADITVPVQTAAMSGVSIAGATLDGSTVNYVKATYAQTDGNTRARVKASGTYSYEVQPGVTITVNSTAPTTYELEIARFFGTSSGLVITQSNRFDKTLGDVTSKVRIPDTWSLVGTGLGISGINAPSITALGPSRIAFIDSTLQELRVYDFNGSTWTQVGTSFSISGVNAPTPAALSSSRIAFIDSANDELRAYDFNGSTWSLVGTGLGISGVGAAAITALSPSRIAFIDSVGDELRTYGFNGSTWAQVGTGLSVSGAVFSKLAALSPSRVAFIDDTIEEFRVYDFNGAAWSQTGTALGISGIGTPAFTALSPSRVVFLDTTLQELRTYNFNGSTWSLLGTALSISGIGFPSITALGPSRIAFLDGTVEELRTYDLSFTDPPPSPAFL